MKPAQFNEQEPVARIVKQGATVKLEWVNADSAHNAKVGNLYTTPPQRKPLTDEQIDFLNFLYGAGEWDGVWFEGKHPTKLGAFWWRKDMKRLFDYGIKGNA